MLTRREVAVTALLALAAGCTAMPIEEAKQATVSVAGSASLAPPPRRIEDITAILKGTGSPESKFVARLKADADAQAPPGAAAAFFFRRGNAAEQLGRYGQGLSDYREAVRLAPRNSDYLSRLAVMEAPLGYFKSGLENAKKSLSISESPGAYGILVLMYAAIGDLESAQKTSLQLNRYCAMLSGTSAYSPKCDLHQSLAGMSLLDLQGKYAEAEIPIRKIISFWEASREFQIAWRLRGLRFLAENLLAQGRFVEGEVQARQAVKTAVATTGSDSVLTSLAVGILSETLRAQGRLADAEQLAGISARGLEAGGVERASAYLGIARMRHGSILFSQGAVGEAMSQFDAAMRDAVSDRSVVRRMSLGSPEYALALVLTGRDEEAARTVADAYAMARQNLGEKTPNTAEWLGIRSMISHRRGDLGAAARDFAVAVEILLSADVEKLDHARVVRLRMILEDYLDLLTKLRGTALEKELGIDAAGAAFRIADAARGNNVQRAIAASSARAAVTDPELGDLVRREQDAQKQAAILGAAVLNLTTAPEQEQQPDVVRDLQSRIVTLNAARTSLQQQILRRFPRYADFVSPQPATLPLARQSLHPGEALVSIYSSGQRTFVWAVPYHGEPVFASSPIGRGEVARMVGTLRKALDPQPERLGDIPPFDLRLAHEIYRKIFEPVEAGWRDATDLLVVDSGPLAALPVAVLPTALFEPAPDKDALFDSYRKVPWFVLRASFTALPSVSSLITLRGLPEGDAGRRAFAGFGDPAFSARDAVRAEKGSDSQLSSRGVRLAVRGVRASDGGSLDSAQTPSMGIEQLQRLADTADELRGIAQALDADLRRDLFLGNSASERTVKTMNLADRKVVAFATHALVPGDLDGLWQPALALSAPSVTHDGEDGLLTMGEILKLKLNADWVVLSACNTGAAEGQGAGAVSGLGRAFFYAGARSMLVSMWPVETQSARRLVTETFRGLGAGGAETRARALRRSMLALIEGGSLADDATGQVSASCAHPLFWAPFVLVGDPGGGPR